jgi:ATP-dependent DNA helicase PIF1
MLNEMRLGKITNETVAAFRNMSRRINYEDSLDATELYVPILCSSAKAEIRRFPTRNEVENANAMKMRSLVGRPYTYNALDTGTITDLAMREKLLANMMAPKTLELKKGAQVMLIKNMDDALVNGSLGKVIAFMDEKTFDIYQNHEELFRDDVTPEDIDSLDEDVRTRYHSLKAKLAPKATGTDMDLPLVQFSLADGTLRSVLVQHEEWKVELPTGEVQAQRRQLPLILAWALSIHKAQGQTLERVKIDLKRVFEKGQAYVALSRATSQTGLEVHNFDKNKVMAHPRVAQFYDSLYSVNKALKHPKVAKPLPMKNAKSYEEEYMKAGMEQEHTWEISDDEEEQAAMAAYG